MSRKGEVKTLGYHDEYRVACEAAESLSLLITDASFKVYRWTEKDAYWVEEAFYINGK
jgi:hypothetical protein